MNSDPTSGTSIRVIINKGIKPAEKIPYKINDKMRTIPRLVPIR
jgi:hypothetical protein